MNNRRLPSRRTFPPRGFSLLEALLLVVILGIVFLGFGIGLQSAAHVPEAVDRRLETHARLVEKMEDLLSMNFTTLSANSGLSDTVTIGGATYPRTVTVATVDADASGAPDADFLQLTVTINGQFLKTRVTQP
jgi:Tfp pilus assembly protein PilV